MQNLNKFRKTLVFLTGANAQSRLPFIAGLQIFNFDNVRIVDTVQDVPSKESFEQCLKTFEELDISEQSKILVFGYGFRELLEQKSLKQTEILKMLAPLLEQENTEIRVFEMPEFDANQQTILDSDLREMDKISWKLEKSTNFFYHSEMQDCLDLQSTSSRLMIELVKILEN